MRADSDDDEEADTTIEQHKWYKKGQTGVKHFKSSFEHACASYGVRHRTWTGRGPRSGIMHVVKGNACKMDVI
jgi:hypothetical protein